MDGFKNPNLFHFIQTCPNFLFPNFLKPILQNPAYFSSSRKISLSVISPVYTCSSFLSKFLIKEKEKRRNRSERERPLCFFTTLSPSPCILTVRLLPTVTSIGHVTLEPSSARPSAHLASLCTRASRSFTPSYFPHPRRSSVAVVAAALPARVAGNHL